MPEKKNTGPSYETIMRDLEARRFSPIYILMGEESYYIDKISDYIATHVLKPEERDFNQNIVFGADVTASQIVDSAKAYPMMAEKRVVIVKESQNLKGTEALEKYFKNPVASTILVLCHKNGSIDKRKKIIPSAQAGGGVIFESKKLYERELPGFIETYLRQHQVTIEPKAAQMIADHVGADLNRLTSELDKLLLSRLTTNGRVTPEVVEKEIGVSKDFNAFELRNAIIYRDIYKANLIIKYFDNNPKAGSLPNRNNENAVANYLELRNAWAAKEYIIGMRNYSGKKTMQIISKIREIDAKSKGLDNPNTGPGELMKELIFFILH